MKFSLLAFALFSTTVFAIGTTVFPKENKLQKHTRIENGATAHGEGKDRLPAYVEQK